MTTLQIRDIEYGTEFCDTRYEGADLAQKPSVGVCQKPSFVGLSLEEAAAAA